MGREIRRVPANWEHPKDARGNHIALYDNDYETSAREWLDNCIAWDNGTHEDSGKHKAETPYFWEWDGGPPHRQKFETEPTWYQMYETVSEGTPVTPPFETKAELVEYLVEYGDYWDQHRGNGGWNRKAAEQFVEAEWAPSLVMMKTGNEVKITTARDGV